MKIEIRDAGEVHISGYVNAVERDSKVLPRFMAHDATSDFVEKVSAGAFARAIKNNPEIRLKLNHDKIVGGTAEGTLTLTEDNIGLRADAVVTDPETVRAARAGELRGWSFGMRNIKAAWEDFKGNVKRRTLNGFTLDEVSILTKNPAYYGTSVEVRSEDGAVIETRETADYSRAALGETLAAEMRAAADSAVGAINKLNDLAAAFAKSAELINNNDNSGTCTDFSQENSENRGLNVENTAGNSDGSDKPGGNDTAGGAGSTVSTYGVNGESGADSAAAVNGAAGGASTADTASSAGTSKTDGTENKASVSDSKKAGTEERSYGARGAENTDLTHNADGVSEPAAACCGEYIAQIELLKLGGE